jgi:V/A-type H+-transporting ATPase subunit I
MQRVALVAGLDDLDRVLVCAGSAGCVEIESDGAAPGAAEGAGPADPLERFERSAARERGTAALVGWCPVEDVPLLGERLGEFGGSLVPLPRPRGIDPPTLLRESTRAHRAFSPLVRGYTTVPYPDVDPTVFAGCAYILMFGLMFGDMGHGLVLIAGALALRTGRIKALDRIRRLWPFVAGAGAAAVAAGLLYGEFFGPTGVVPALWLRPLDQPLRLLAYAVVLGAVLLAAAYVLGSVNRWHEAGPGSALYAASGMGGATAFLGLAVLAIGVWRHSAAVQIAGAALAAAGLAAVGVGLAATSPRGLSGGFQVGLGLVDTVTGIASNAISFSRLAAFGLTHAALGSIIWQGTTGLAHHGAFALAGAVLLFAVGNAVAFALEGLVVGVQAMRLEYYEMFSRIFASSGRPFQPFRLSPIASEVTP